MQLRVVGRRAEAGYFVCVGQVFHSADCFSLLKAKRQTKMYSACSAWANTECLQTLQGKEENMSKTLKVAQRD